MMNIDDFDESLEMTYPCVWRYKIIGLNADSLREAVEAVINRENFLLAASNKSAKGKFVSFNLSVEVESKEHRLEILTRLKNIAAVKMIL